MSRSNRLSVQLVWLETAPPSKLPRATMVLYCELFAAWIHSSIEKLSSQRYVIRSVTRLLMLFDEASEMESAEPFRHTPVWSGSQNED